MARIGCENMDIASMSIELHQASIENSAQISVMKMAMNSVDVNSGEVINMMEDMAVEPYKGEHIDSTV